MMSFGVCVCVCNVSEWVWSCSRSAGWVTGRIPRRSRRTHVGRRCPHQVSPPGAPTMCPDQVPWPCPAQTFLYHLFLLWKSINGRFSNRKWVVQKILPGPGRGTWSGHLVGTPPTNMSPPAPAGCPPGYPPHTPGTWSHTHTHRKTS